MRIKTYKKYKELNFHKLKTMYVSEPDKYFYIYRITNIKEHKHYYGCRVSSVHPSNDLAVKYISSSSDSEFKEEQKSNKENFKYKIIKIFDNNADKILYECFLHQYFDVKTHSDFYNISNAIPNGFDTTGFITCLDLSTNEFTLVLRDEFYSNPHLVGVGHSMVNCRNNITKETLQVSKEEFDKNPDLVGISTSKVTCFDINTSERKHVSIEEFYTNDSLVSHNTNHVNCKILGTDVIIKVSKEEFDKNPDLVGTTKGVNLKFTQEHKDNISKSMTGKPKSETHRMNLSKANKGKVACKLIGTNEIIFVSKEEFDKNPDLVGTTKNTDKYTIITNTGGTVVLIGKTDFYKYCSDNKLSSVALLKSLETKTAVSNNSNFYKKTLNERIKNAIDYQLISIEEFF